MIERDIQARRLGGAPFLICAVFLVFWAGFSAAQSAQPNQRPPLRTSSTALDTAIDASRAIFSAPASASRPAARNPFYPRVATADTPDQSSSGQTDSALPASEPTASANLSDQDATRSGVPVQDPNSAIAQDGTGQVEAGQNADAARSTAANLDLRGDANQSNAGPSAQTAQSQTPFIPRPPLRKGVNLPPSGAGIDLRALASPELAGKRPQLRPNTLLEQAIAADTQTNDQSRQIVSGIKELEEQERQFNLATASRFAVKSSARAALRPKGLKPRFVRATATEDQTKKAAAVATTRASKAPKTDPEAETANEGATGLFTRGKLSLIGVYGTASQRRALIRTATGRYVRVKPGQNVSGWRVSAIGESSVKVVRGARSRTLRLP